MRMLCLMLAGAVAIATPAMAQDTNAVTADPSATDMTADPNAAAPVTDPALANDVVLTPGEATTAMPAEPVTMDMEPMPVEEPEPSGRFPWGLLGLLGLVGLLGRGRKSS